MLSNFYYCRNISIAKYPRFHKLSPQVSMISHFPASHAVPFTRWPHILQQFAILHPHDVIVYSSKCPYSLLPLIIHSECDVITPTIAIIVHCSKESRSPLTSWFVGCTVTSIHFLSLSCITFCLVPYFYDGYPDVKSPILIFILIAYCPGMFYNDAKLWNFICLRNNRAL